MKAPTGKIVLAIRESPAEMAARSSLRAFSHDAARKMVRAIARSAPSPERPDLYVLSASPSARSGHIFLDYLRNGRGNTAVGAWSPRPRPGLPIAVPVTWAQVEAGIKPDAFTMAHPFRRKRTAGRFNSPRRLLCSEAIFHRAGSVAQCA